jgi:tetratricopeptide (TPR) repeat protein
LEELIKLEPHVAKNRQDLAGTLYNIGAIRDALGKQDGALEANHAALAIRRQMSAEFPDQPDYRFLVAASLGNIGHVMSDLKGDYVAALAYFGEAESLLAEMVRSYPDVAKYHEFLARGRSNLASTLFSVGHVETALAVGQSAETYLVSRIKGESTLIQSRVDLAHNLAQQAEGFRWLRRFDQAEQLGQRAEESLASIAATNWELPNVIEAVMYTFNVLGDIAVSQGDFTQARERYSGTILATQPDQAKPPANPQVRSSLRHALRCRAEASARSSRLESARADWSRVVSLQDKGDSDIASLGTLLIRAWSGDAAGFLAQAETAISARSVPRDELITLAVAACGAIANAKPDARLTERLGASAVAWLRVAAADGAFAHQGAPVAISDTRIDPIAHRVEFRDLKADLAFPAYPFATTDEMRK